MNDIQPFTFANVTEALPVLTTSTSVTLPLVNSSGNSSGSVQVVASNSGANVVYLTWGAPGVTAAIPTAGAPTQCMPLLGQTQQTFTVPDGATFAAIAAATGNTLLLTAGWGF